MSAHPPSERTRVRRRAERGRYGRDEVTAILDAAWIAHVALAGASGPRCLPTAFARLEERLYLHGSPSNALLRALAEGAEACVAVTLLDALVLARSAAHHSLNYRSVVLYARGERVDDPAVKLASLRALTDKLVPGRWQDCRAPSEEELRGTLVVALPIDEASAKVRDTPPADLEEDLALGHWAGVVPLETRLGAPIPDPLLAGDPGPPAYLVPREPFRTARGPR